jgi:hypothetical protein
MKLKEKLTRIALVCVVIGSLLVAIGTLATQPVNSTNTTLVKGSFRNIKETVSRGEYYYAIYIQENDQHYEIPADWHQCFYYHDFKNNVKPGQFIQIRLSKNLFRSPEVSSITVNNLDYLSQTCINEDIHDNKIILAPACIGIAILISLFLYFKKPQKQVS